MSLSQRITAELKEAIKAKDVIRISCMRMLKADLKNRQVEKGSDLEDREIERKIKEIISELSATGSKDLGRVMKAAMEQMAGKVQGKEVNEIARKLLS